jgi:hypothetical protein
MRVSFITKMVVTYSFFTQNFPRSEASRGRATGTFRISRSATPSTPDKHAVKDRLFCEDGLTTKLMSLDRNLLLEERLVSLNARMGIHRK